MMRRDWVSMLARMFRPHDGDEPMDKFLQYYLIAGIAVGASIGAMIGNWGLGVVLSLPLSVFGALMHRLITEPPSGD
jgi:hypothetical protein